MSPAVMVAVLVFAIAGCGWVGLKHHNVRGCVRPAETPSGPGGDIFTIVALGDFGDAATGRNVEVAKALKRYLDERDVAPDSVVLLGDNFYPSGLIGTRTACVPFRETAPDGAIAAQLRGVVGPFSFLRRQTTVWALPGNHDHICPGLGSLENQRSIDHWLPEELAWGERWQLVDGAPRTIVDDARVQLVGIDSTPMIRSRLALTEAAERLEGLLDDGRDRWRLVAAHHPLYSNGHHDGAWFSGTFAKTLYYPTHLLLFPPYLYGGHGQYEWSYRRYRRRLEDVFTRKPAHVFLGGHEHALEILRPAAPGQPLTLVSGAAARCGKIMRRDNTIVSASKNGFAVIEATADTLSIELVATTGCDRRAPCARPATPGEWHVLSRVVLDRSGRTVTRACPAASAS